MKSVTSDICLKKNTLLKNTYRIKKVISCSELSIVYFGRHVESGDIQIIKEYFPKALVLRDLDDKTVLCRLPSSKEKYYELMEAFFNEATIIKELCHKNIVGYIDHFEENGTGYIVMEYCRGKTLNRYIKEEKTVSMVAFFHKTLFSLMDALDFIHKKGIIHRDIKPENILISKEGQPILLDFGSAVYYKNHTRHKIFTTPGFSPLEFYSEKSKLGIYSDIYSLAATFYYYLTGRVPLDVSERLIEDRIENVRHYNREVTPLLSSVIMWGLSVNYKRRCSSLKLFKIAFYLEYLLLKIKKLWMSNGDSKQTINQSQFMKKYF